MQHSSSTWPKNTGLRLGSLSEESCWGQSPVLCYFVFSTSASEIGIILQSNFMYFLPASFSTFPCNCIINILHPSPLYSPSIIVQAEHGLTHEHGTRWQSLIKGKRRWPGCAHSPSPATRVDCRDSPSAHRCLGDAPPSQAPVPVQEGDGNGGRWQSILWKEGKHWVVGGKGQLVWRKEGWEMLTPSPALRDRWFQELLPAQRLAKNVG